MMMVRPLLRPKSAIEICYSSRRQDLLAESQRYDGDGRCAVLLYCPFSAAARAGWALRVCRTFPAAGRSKRVKELRRQFFFPSPSPALRNVRVPQPGRKDCLQGWSLSPPCVNPSQYRVGPARSLFPSMLRRCARRLPFGLSNRNLSAGCLHRQVMLPYLRSRPHGARLPAPLFFFFLQVVFCYFIIHSVVLLLLRIAECDTRPDQTRRQT